MEHSVCQISISVGVKGGRRYILLQRLMQRIQTIVTLKHDVQIGLVKLQKENEDANIVSLKWNVLKCL